MTLAGETLVAQPRIVVLSGPVGSGKSTLAEQLVRDYGAAHVRTQELIKDEAARRGRTSQKNGELFRFSRDRLDTETGGQWVANGVGRLIADGELDSSLVIIDAVRILRQIEHLRDAFPSRVTHIHLYAPDDALSARYERRRGVSHIVELESYSAVAENQTERNTRLLARMPISLLTRTGVLLAMSKRAPLPRFVLWAHAARDSWTSSSEANTGARAKATLRFFGRRSTTYLCGGGGPNAGHKVPVGGAFTQRILPSGTRANEQALLLIGPGATLDVEVLLKEIADCAVEKGRLFIDLRR